MSALITVQQIVSAFQEIIGWPYASRAQRPQGIDCSGAFVFAYQKYKHTIYHGSTGLSGVLLHGVTHSERHRQSSRHGDFQKPGSRDSLKAEYKPGGKYYNSALPEDFTTSAVASVNPLQIINATPPAAGGYQAVRLEPRGLFEGGPL